MKKIILSILCYMLCLSVLVGQNASSNKLNKQAILSNTAIVQDYDGDGDLDIIATERDPDRLIWLENEPTQQFPLHVIVDVDIRRPADVDVADLDDDGDMDYVVCSQSGVGGTDPGELIWFQRQEDDTYIKWSIEVGKDFVRADLADFNGDGLMDIVAVARDQKEINVYINDGSLNFSSKTVTMDLGSPGVVDTDDIDGDGDIDIAFEGSVYLNDGNGDFIFGYGLFGWTDSISSGDGRLLIVDLNNDGIKDILMFDITGLGGLYFLDGSMSFDQTLIDRVGIDTGGSFVVADFDGNGLLDIVRQHSGVNSLTILYQTSSLEFSRQTLDLGWSGTFLGSQMIAADLDGDGDQDLVVPNNSTILTDKDIAWYENINGQLFHHYLHADFLQSRVPKMGDFDKDGDLDIFLTVSGHSSSSDFTDNDVILFENLDGQNYINWRLNGAIPVDYAADIELGDADGDGDLDAFVSARDANDLLLFRNDGLQANWRRDTLEQNANAPLGLALGDMDGDNDLDAVLCSFGDAKVFWYQNDGNAEFTRFVVDSNIGDPIEAEIADLNGDNVNDIAVISEDTDNAVVIYLANNSGGFEKEVVYTGKSSRDIEIGDWDSDGDADVIVSFYDTGASVPDNPVDLLLLVNDGSGNFSSTVLLGIRERTHGISLKDIDRDGDLDVVMGNDDLSFSQPSLIHVAINTNGEISELVPMTDVEGGTVRGIDVGDTNGDGNMEIVYADFGRDDLVLLTDLQINPGVAPVDMDLSALSFDENLDIGTVIATLSTTDTDQDSGHTYALMAGEGSTDNDLFSISDNQLLTNGSFDFESRVEYSIRLRTTDSDELFYEESFVLTVMNVEEPEITLSGDLSFEPTGVRSSRELSFTIANSNNDGALLVTDVIVPEGFSVSETSFSIEEESSEEVTVTFSPSEVKAYTGSLVVRSNAGEAVLEISGEGAIITATENPLDNSEDFSLYPNPGSSIVTIKIPTRFIHKEGWLELTSVFGKVLFHKTVNQSNKELSIDVSGYSEGVVIVRLNTGHDILTKRLIIKREP